MLCGADLLCSYFFFFLRHSALSLLLDVHFGGLHVCPYTFLKENSCWFVRVQLSFDEGCFSDIKEPLCGLNRWLLYLTGGYVRRKTTSRSRKDVNVHTNLKGIINVPNNFFFFASFSFGFLVWSLKLSKFAKCVRLKENMLYKCKCFSLFV